DSAARGVLAIDRRTALQGRFPVTRPSTAAATPVLAPSAPKVELDPAARLELPEYVQIEPVGQCNLRCKMCAIQFREDGRPPGPPAFMELDVFRRLVDQMERMTHLHLQGLGEPLMHPRFFDMVGYAVGKGVRVTTNTNLTLLTPRRAERMLDSG